jgi:Arc/MetJ-type ribon-helix-helix transcriptional regulator
MGDVMPAADGKDRSADGGFTPVMVRLTAAELETVDTLIAAGIASSRAEAIRWALTRIRERPAYERLRRRAREIESLKAEF